MRVRWTTDAADDLERICDYIARERPEPARRLALDVLRAIEGSARFQTVDDLDGSKVLANSC